MTDALYKVVKAGPKNALLNSRLKTLAGSDQPVLLILSHCEGLRTATINMEEHFSNILLELITTVPKMQIILTTTKVMKVIGSLIATKAVTIELLKEELATGVAFDTLNDIMDDIDGAAGEVHKKLLTSLKRSLSYHAPKTVEKLILLTVFPSYFDLLCLEKVLGVKEIKAKNMLKLLTENNLLQETGDGSHVVVPLVRDYARSTNDHMVSKETFRDTKVKFVHYCYHLVNEAFADSITTPSDAYNTMSKRKSNIQASLAMGADPDIATQCNNDCLKILSCLDYANVYSTQEIMLASMGADPDIAAHAQEITQACKTLADNYLNDPISRGCCLAVASLFYDANKISWLKALVM
eukprot:gene7623-780_t